MMTRTSSSSTASAATISIVLCILGVGRAFQKSSSFLMPSRPIVSSRDHTTSLHSSSSPPGPLLADAAVPVPPQQSDATITATTAEDDDAAISTTASSTSSFVSRPMQVYIEDTDAYGVMYNANYLRAYERALHQIDLPPPKQQRAGGGEGGALSDPSWLVIGATEHRFKGSPPLGGEFIIKGELLLGQQKNDGGEVETWKCEMISCPPKPTPSDDMNQLDNNNNDFKPTVYNTAVLTIASSQAAQNHIASPPFAVGRGHGDDKKKKKRKKGSSSSSSSSSNNNLGGGSIVRSTYEPFRDEFDAAIGHLHRMPLRNVLNLFERARSDYLGGPAELQKMQVQDGIVWVVTGVDDCELCNLHDNNNDTKEDNNEPGGRRRRIPNVQCRAGEQVTVKTNFVAKRGGMIIECQQTLLVSTWDETKGVCRNRRLAQGVVTIMALDAKSRRPTRKIPSWFLDKISNDGGGGGGTAKPPPSRQPKARTMTTTESVVGKGDDSTKKKPTKKSKPAQKSPPSKAEEEKVLVDTEEESTKSSTKATTPSAAEKDVVSVVVNSAEGVGSTKGSSDSFPWDKCQRMSQRFPHSMAK